MLWTISRRILISRGWWVTVHNCARRKRTSIMCASNLPSLPWKITSKVHKIRTTLKRRSNLPACLGKPLPPQSGKIPASSKAAAAAAATAAAILIDSSENEVHFYEEIRQNLDCSFRMTDVQKTPRWHSHLQVCMVRHHDEHEEEDSGGCHTSSIEKKILGRCHTHWVKSYFQDWGEDYKINWKRIHVWGLVTVEDSKQDLKSVKMKMKNKATFVRSEDIPEK